MPRAFAAIAIATAFHLLAVLHGASAARPMGWQAAASSGTATSALALAPAGHQNHQRRAAAAAAARAGKWLPFAGVHHHLPAAAAYWAHRPVPWVGAGGLAGGAGAVEGSEGEEVMRERERERRQQRPSYEGDGSTTTTRQEQLAMWASLLNPKGKGRAATGWMPAPGAGEVVDEEPAKAADAVEGAEVDDTAADGARVGQTYWGNNGN
ncbi:unnamed protein product [Miscanthus lutarioriparius]|uniref:Uncharacterized protein n=1 Tax=Miscanthus lutarioriparius TaxID=422564 RepID=A0A811MWJ8_9POAL|nr:unnamed protein product [Miscanthus lutarioriparius]